MQSDQTSTETEIRDVEAAILARAVAKEIDLERIVERTPVSYYFGDTIPGALTRVACTGVIAYSWLCIGNGETWSFLALAVTIFGTEASRLNEKITALSRLMQIRIDRISTESK